MLVPFLMTFILLNILNEYDIIKPDEQSMYFIDNRMLCFIPIGLGFLLIANVWWYVEQDGRELFYLWRKVIFEESVVLTVLFELAVFVEFIIVYRGIVGFRWDMLTNYITFSFFVSGGVLCLIYRIRRMTVFIAIFVLCYLFELCGDYGLFGTYSFFAWHYCKSQDKNVVFLLNKNV